METENTDCQKRLFEKLMNQSDRVKKISVNNSDLPKFELSICDVEISAPFLLDKLVKDFFQYLRNAFDCMSQAVNASCLANNGKSVEQVDFSKMKKTLNEQPYSSDFPSITDWYNSIDNCDEFKYIQDFNNRTKHICDVYIKMSMAIVGEDETSISPFYKKNTQHNKQDVKNYLTSIYDFVSDAYSKFMNAIKPEIVKQKYVENRYQTLTVYQQKFKNEEGFSMPYIETCLEAEKLPDTIYVLFVKETDDRIIAKNCPMNKIFFKKIGTENEYLGKYFSNELCGDDTLYQYRSYKKENTNLASMPLAFNAMMDEECKNHFYHQNAFIDIVTVSDDDEFLGRVSLPF